MKGKNNEVRIAVAVLAMLFLIIVVNSLINIAFNSATLQVDAEEAGMTTPSPDGGTSLMVNTTAHNAGTKTLNNKLLAAEAYRDAANKGDAEAQYKLGEAYGNGQVVPGDPLAMSWYRLSAEQGYALAQNRLGTIYEASGTDEIHLIVAYALFRLADTNTTSSTPLATVNLREIQLKMTPIQIEEGDVLVMKLRDLPRFLKHLDQALTP